MAESSDHLAVVLRQLARFRHYPKYALERRLDIFMAPFLAPTLARRWGGKVRLIAPEFPLRKNGVKNHSTNVDFLIHAELPRPRWILVELKTYERSVSKQQAIRYLEASALGMKALVENIEKIATASADEMKYRRLLRRLRAFAGAHTTFDGHCDDIGVLYIAPGRRPEVEPFQRRNTAGRELIEWIALEEFFGGEAPMQPQLWKALAQLVGVRPQYLPPG